MNINSLSPGATVPFKFVINGNSWETGDDRTFTLAASDQVLPIEYFDRVNNLGPLAVSFTVLPFDVQIGVSWTAGPRIRLQTRGDLASAAWEDVPNTLGQNSATFTFDIDARPPGGFFRLIGPQWDSRLQHQRVGTNVSRAPRLRNCIGTFSIASGLRRE